MTSPNRATIRDPATMRALAHPARLALLEHLSNSTDGATATECALVVGLSPSATSYHLRALAKVGMISEAPGRGDGRERVWQATHQVWDIGSEEGAGEEQVAAELALAEAFLARQNETVRRYIAGASAEPRDWYHASVVTNRTMLVTAAELRRLTEQIDELVEPLLRRNRTQPPEGARVVSFQLRAVPTDPG